MNKIENYLGIANHDIQMANNSQELKSYVASILCENDELQQENQKYKEVIDKVKFAIKTNCIKNGKKYEEICCDGDYLLQILEDKRGEINGFR